MSQTKIEWTDYSWNVVTGCTPVSEGCENCYAKRMATRLRGRCGYPEDEPFRVTLHPERLEEPLKWKKPRRVFVCSMGDLFHEDVPEKFIYDVWDVMVLNRQHTFLVLTKRPARMKNFIERVMANRMYYAYTLGNTPEGTETRKWAQKPVQNIWLGVTAENQQRADERIPILLQTPAAIRFVSCEPMLGPVKISQWLRSDWEHCQSCGRAYSNVWWADDNIWRVVVSADGSGLRCPSCFVKEASGFQVDAPKTDYVPEIDWVICGGETGPNARPMHPDWVRRLRDQCQAAGVPFFFKSWGEWHESDLQPNPRGWRTHLWSDGKLMYRMGRKKAGRLLDGQEWNEYPKQYGWELC